MRRAVGTLGKLLINSELKPAYFLTLIVSFLPFLNLKKHSLQIFWLLEQSLGSIILVSSYQNCVFFSQLPEMMRHLSLQVIIGSFSVNSRKDTSTSVKGDPSGKLPSPVGGSAASSGGFRAAGMNLSSPSHYMVQTGARM